MEVKRSIETKTYAIFETPTHSFKINEEKIEELKINQAALQTKIQKGMKQTVEVSNAEWWDESWKSIFETITGQKLLEEGKLGE